MAELVVGVQVGDGCSPWVQGVTRVWVGVCMGGKVWVCVCEVTWGLLQNNNVIFHSVSRCYKIICLHCFSGGC